MSTMECAGCGQLVDTAAAPRECPNCFRSLAPPAGSAASAREFEPDTRRALVLTYQKTGQQIRLSGAERWVLGREGAGSDVLMGVVQVSRQHCVVEREGGSFVATDLGSTHGTFVGTDKKNCFVTPKVALSEGAPFFLGRELFRVSFASEAAPVAVPTARAPETPFLVSAEPAAVKQPNTSFRCPACGRTYAERQPDDMCPDPACGFMLVE